MDTSLKFPAATVVNSFASCEKMLFDVLQIIPYCSAHEKVWSPALATVILEACTQLDSLWRLTAWASPYVREKKKRSDDLRITDYFECFHEALTGRWAVFWAEQPELIRPFAQWDQEGGNHRLDWWQSYNFIKHNRFENREKATLQFAVKATAGLFLAILRNENCREEVACQGWLSFHQCLAYNPASSLCEDSASTKDSCVAVESKLFSYPVGWCNAPIASTDSWAGECSPRFRKWFDAYVQTG